MRQQQYKSNCLLYVIFGLVSFTVFSSMIISYVTSAVYADTTNVTTVTATVPNSCSFSSGGGSYNGSYDPNTSNVVTGNNIVTSCNDGSGYAIYAVGYSNDSYTGTNTDLIHSTNTNYNIKTDGSGNYNSSWKMKVTSVSNATIAGGFNNFQNIPSSFTKIASYTTNTTEGIITPSYQINIGNAQPAGVYTGKVKYVLVHPNTMMPASSVYTIAYNANGGSGTMNSSTDVPTFESFTLPTNTFTAPSGYTFAGWCTTNTAGSYACDGTSYAVGDKVTSLASAGGTATLYAYWQEMSKIYMQDLTSTTIAILLPNKGDTATVYDSRDEQAYTIAKLEDGKYWMTKNLNLAGGTTISCDTSDCDNYTIPTTQGWQSGGKLPASSTSGFDTDNYAYVYNSGSTTCGDNSPCYSYYSWDAATLGSGRSISTDNQNAPYSICPKGWRLPTTYNGSGTAAEATDFRALMIAFGGSNSVQTYGSSTSPTGATMSTTLQSTPNNFLLAGYYLNGSFSNGGSRGSYWSATSASSSSYARYLFFSSTGVYSAGNSTRRGGYSVRCVYGG